MDDSFSHKGTEMKSLEHIIREIVSKKKLKETEPTMQSELNLPLGTSKYQGNQFTGEKHVTPKISPGSTEAAKDVSVARNITKGQKSATMSGVWKESLGSTIVKTMLKGAKGAEKVVDTLADLKVAPSTKGRELVPYVKKEVEVATKAAPKTEVPANIATASKEVAKQETKAVAKAEPKTDVATKTDAKAVVSTPTQTKTQTQTKMPAIVDTAVATKPAKTPPVPAVATQTKTLSAPVVATPTKTATAPAVVSKTPTKPPGPGPKIPALPGFGSGGSRGSKKDVTHHFGDKIPVPVNVHLAKKHKMHEEKESEGTKIRKQVTNVGRPWTTDTNFSPKSRLAKQAEIKTKIIDESKKLAGVIKNTVKKKKITENDPVINGGKTIAYPQVVINPPMKFPDSRET